MTDHLDRGEDQLTELTERGAHQRSRDRGAGLAGTGGRGPRPPRRPRRPRSLAALAILAAAAVVAAVLGIVLVNLHAGNPNRTEAPAHSTPSKPATAPSTGAAKPPTTTSPPPLPARFAPQSFTAIGELTWWVLGPAACPSCGAILHTTDGGRTFTAVHAPHAPLATSTSAHAGYSQLRFADPKHGFAYGPDLYATHDGGITWHPVDLNGSVTELAISAGEAYATVEPARRGNGRLMHSPASRDAWSTVPAAGVVSGGLWVQGSDVIVQSGVGTGIGGNVLVSHDAGQSFSASPAPSPGLPCQFAAPEPPVVWAHCATGTESGVWRSSDDGAHFTVTAGGGTSLRLPNSAAFAAASASTAVVGYQPLYRTTSDGSLWSPVGPSGVAQWAYLGFTDSTHGVGLGYVGSLAPTNERLFYTTDAGQTYHLVRLP